MKRLLLAILLSTNLLLVALALSGIFLRHRAFPELALLQLTDLVGIKEGSEQVALLLQRELEQATGKALVTLPKVDGKEKPPSFDELVSSAKSAGAKVLLWGTVNDYSTWESSSSVSVSIYAIDLDNKKTVWTENLTRRFDNISVQRGAQVLMRDVAKRMVQELAAHSA